MGPLLSSSERERRTERRAKCLIVAIFSLIGYALLWHWEYLQWSAGGVALVIAVLLFLGFFAIVNNPVELTVVCLIILVLAAVALPTFRRTQIRSREITELANGRNIVVTLLFYVHDHGDKFPEKLSGVPLDNIPAAAIHFHDPRTRQESDWLYYGGDSREPHAPFSSRRLSSSPRPPWLARPSASPSSATGPLASLTNWNSRPCSPNSSRPSNAERESDSLHLITVPSAQSVVKTAPLP